MFEDFGHRKKKIAQLTEEKAALQARVEAVEGDPYFALAKEIGREVTDLIAQGAGNAAISAAIADERERAKQERIEEFAREQIREELAAQKTFILEAEEVAAAKLARLAMQRFMLEEADEYRAQVRARLEQEAPAEAIYAARKEIEAEERSRRVELEKQRILDSKVAVSEREDQRQRAQEIRKTTKKTHLLRLHELQDGDPLTITFSGSGDGFESLTSYNEYNSRNELRKITGKITNSTIGAFEVEKDSWFSSSHRHLALRGGQEVLLRAPDHLVDKDSADDKPELANCIAKGAPLTIMSMREQDLDLTPNLDVWWVNLGDFKALS